MVVERVSRQVSKLFLQRSFRTIGRLHGVPSDSNHKHLCLAQTRMLAQFLGPPTHTALISISRRPSLDGGSPLGLELLGGLVGAEENDGELHDGGSRHGREVFVELKYIGIRDDLGVRSIDDAGFLEGTANFSCLGGALVGIKFVQRGPDCLNVRECWGYGGRQKRLVEEGGKKKKKEKEGDGGERVPSISSIPGVSLGSSGVP